MAPVGRWDKDHFQVSLLAGFSLEAVGHLACTSSTPDIAGEDLLEIGVPFSDTTADGPVIQSASRSKFN